ncbi:MAG TPA: CGNR zinc finger domain-containing protein [Candidatus Limnocylindrales bacterium]|jgi:predicted RNA-binding Zn ribbon-like protein
MEDSALHGHGRHGHQASLDDLLEFVNTLELTRDGPRDELADLPTALRWLQAHELLHRPTLDALLARHARAPESSAASLRHIHRLRSAMRELLDATVEQRLPAAGALRDVNRALRTHYVQELVPAPNGVSLDHRHDGDPIAGALARLADAAAREVTAPDLDRLRICANDDCRWVFKDESPGGRRKWCDMRTCGNRAKVARHRERAKEQAAAT